MMMRDQHIEYVTARIDGQLFGLPISRVRDVFVPERITRVPLADNEIAGILNLRGRIVTVISIHQLLGLVAFGRDTTISMAIGVEYQGESYGLSVDSVGEVLKLPAAELERNPINLVPRMARIASGVHRLETEIMVVLDINRVLGADALAA